MIKILFGTFFFIAAIVFIFFNSSFVAQHNDWANIVISTIGTLSLYMTFLINHSEKVFLFWRKSIEYIKNSTISWDLSAQFTIVELEEHFLRKESQKILDVSGNGKVMHPDQLTDSIMKWGEYTLDWNQKFNTLTLRMKTKTNYRESKEEIYIRFQKIISELERLTSGITNEKYTLSIDYNGDNPFYGAYVKRLSNNNGSDIKLSFRENGIYVDSHNSKLSITSNDYEDIKKVARNYFVLKV